MKKVWDVDEDVPNRGDELSPVLWKNGQWAVTTFGLECRDGTYAIAKDGLWEDGLAFHMAEKTWVDRIMFSEALASAIDIHKSAGPR